MREQSISEAIGSMDTPEPDTFARVADAIMQRGAALLKEADAIVTGPAPSGQTDLNGTGRIAHQVGAIVAGILAEAAATLIKGVQVASMYEYGDKDGRTDPATARENPTVQRIKQRTAEILETVNPTTLIVQHTVAHLLADHGAIGLPCKADGSEANAGMPEGLRALLDAMQSGGPRGEGRERKRKAIGFGRLPKIDDDDLPQV